MQGVKSIVLTGCIGTRTVGDDTWGYLSQGDDDSASWGDLRDVLANLYAAGWSGVTITIERNKYWQAER